MINELAINKRIRELRDHLNIGRGEFAEKTGISKNAIINLEQGKQKAYAWHCEAISKVFPKYTYWITTGKVIPEVGQISPEIEEELLRQNLKSLRTGTY
ncbi:MAG: helix-turn-helix transcriptional regulator [Methylococcales bacterium]|nr:helix-turn-helix transcriptional regulator [Methylococcales bacterium]